MWNRLRWPALVALIALIALALAGGCSTLPLKTHPSVDFNLEAELTEALTPTESFEVSMSAVRGGLIGISYDRAILSLQMPLNGTASVPLAKLESGLARLATTAHSDSLQIEPKDTQIARLS